MHKKNVARKSSKFRGTTYYLKVPEKKKRGRKIERESVREIEKEREREREKRSSRYLRREKEGDGYLLPCRPAAGAKRLPMPVFQFERAPQRDTNGFSRLSDMSKMSEKPNRQRNKKEAD